MDMRKLEEQSFVRTESSLTVVRTKSQGKRSELLPISIILRIGRGPKRGNHYLAAMGLAHVQQDEDYNHASS